MMQARLVPVLAVLLVSMTARAVAEYKATEVKNAGSITGVVRWAGEPPQRERLPISSPDKPCHLKSIMNEDLVVSREGGVQWVVAYIKKIESGKPFAHPDDGQPITLDQEGCHFKPHVVLVPDGQTLRVLNNDGILHNVHLYSRKNQPVNVSMPGEMKELTVTFDYSERIRVGCDIHPWMSAWIVVTKHPYYAVTGADGVFRFEDVPAGTYTVELWHEKLGRQESQVTVAAGGETDVEFVLKED